MYFNPKPDQLPENLNLTPFRLDELNEALDKAFDFCFAKPAGFNMADLSAHIAPTLKTPEEAYYCAFHIGQAFQQLTSITKSIQADATNA